MDGNKRRSTAAGIVGGLVLTGILVIIGTNFGVKETKEGVSGAKAPTFQRQNNT